jgi:hypothetical protein
MEVPGVKTACYVRMVDEWNQFVVGSTFEVSVAFAEVDVDFDRVFDCRHLGDGCCIVMISR